MRQRLPAAGLPLGGANQDQDAVVDHRREPGLGKGGAQGGGDIGGKIAEAGVVGGGGGADHHRPAAHGAVGEHGAELEADIAAQHRRAQGGGGGEMPGRWRPQADHAALLGAAEAQEIEVVQGEFRGGRDRAGGRVHHRNLGADGPGPWTCQEQTAAGNGGLDRPEAGGGQGVVDVGGQIVEAGVINGSGALDLHPAVADGLARSEEGRGQVRGDRVGIGAGGDRGVGVDIRNHQGQIHVIGQHPVRGQGVRGPEDELRGDLGRGGVTAGGDRAQSEKIGVGRGGTHGDIPLHGGQDQLAAFQAGAHRQPGGGKGGVDIGHQVVGAGVVKGGGPANGDRGIGGGPVTVGETQGKPHVHGQDTGGGNGVGRGEDIDTCRPHRGGGGGISNPQGGRVHRRGPEGEAKGAGQGEGVTGKPGVEIHDPGMDKGGIDVGHQLVQGGVGGITGNGDRGAVKPAHAGDIDGQGHVGVKHRRRDGATCEHGVEKDLAGGKIAGAGQTDQGGVTGGALDLEGLAAGEDETARAVHRGGEIIAKMPQGPIGAGAVITGNGPGCQRRVDIGGQICGRGVIGGGGGADGDIVEKGIVHVGGVDADHQADITAQVGGGGQELVGGEQCLVPDLVGGQGAAQAELHRGGPGVSDGEITGAGQHQAAAVKGGADGRKGRGGKSGVDIRHQVAKAGIGGGGGGADGDRAVHRAASAVIHAQVQGHVAQEPAARGQGHGGADLGVFIMDHRRQHRRQPQEVEILRGRQDLEVIGGVEHDKGGGVVMGVDPAEHRAGGKGGVDVAKEHTRGPDPGIVEGAGGGDGHRAGGGGGAHPFAQVDDHVGGQAAVPGEGILGHDPGQGALGPGRGLDLVKIGLGEDLDVAGATDVDGAVLAPGVEMGRSFKQDAVAGEVEGIAVGTEAGIITAADGDGATGHDVGSDTDLVLGADRHRGMIGHPGQGHKLAAGVAAGLHIAHRADGAAGDDMALDGRVTGGINGDGAVIGAGGDLARPLDMNPGVLVGGAVQGGVLDGDGVLGLERTAGGHHRPKQGTGGLDLEAAGGRGGHRNRVEAQEIEMAGGRRQPEIAVTGKDNAVVFHMHADGGRQTAGDEAHELGETGKIGGLGLGDGDIAANGAAGGGGEAQGHIIAQTHLAQGVFGPAADGDEFGRGDADGAALGLPPVQFFAQEVAVLIKVQVTVHPGIDMTADLDAGGRGEDHPAVGRVAGAAGGGDPAGGIDQHAGPELLVRGQGVVTGPKTEIIAAAAVAGEPHRVAGQDPAIHIDPLTGGDGDLGIRPLPGDAVSADGAAGNDGAQDVDVAGPVHGDAGTGGKGGDDGGGLHQDAAGPAAGKIGVLAPAVDRDAVIDLDKGGGELDPLAGGLDCETGVGATDKDRALDQDIVRAGELQGGVVGVGGELAGELDTGVHLVEAAAVVLVAAGGELHLVTGIHGAEDAQLVAGGDNDVRTGADDLLDPAVPGHPGQDLAVDIGRLRGVDLDAAVGAGGGHHPGDLHELEIGPGVDGDPRAGAADPSLSLEDHGMGGGDGDDAAVLAGLQEAGDPLDEVVEPAVGRGVGAGEHGRGEGLAGPHDGGGDITVGLQPAVENDPVGDIQGQGRGEDAGIGQAELVMDILGIDMEEIGVQGQAAGGPHITMHVEIGGVQGGGIGEGGVDHQRQAGGLVGGAVHDIAEHHALGKAVAANGD